MYSKTFAVLAAFVAAASVAALPAANPTYVELAERDFYDMDSQELVAREYLDMDSEDLLAREFYDAEFQELVARGHGHGGNHPHGPHGHHGHGGHFRHPAHHYKPDGTLKSKSGRRRANRRLRKQQEAAAAAAAANGGAPTQTDATASQPAPGATPQGPTPDAGAQAQPQADPSQQQQLSRRDVELEERGFLEAIGLKARTADLTPKQTAIMNKAKQICGSLSSKKDQKKCHKNVDKIIQLTKERNYDVEQFVKHTGHHDVFTSSDPSASTPSSTTPSLSARV